MQELFRDIDVSQVAAHAAGLFDATGFKLNPWLQTEQQIWGKNSPYRSRGELPAGPVRELALLCLEYWRERGLSPNTVYLQRTHPGGYLPRHRDPFTDKHFTTIAYFGDFVGSKLVVEDGTSLECKPGSAVMLPCTIGSKQGPFHWTTPHSSGTRWTLIMNCVLK